MCLGDGAMSADARWYFVPTNVGIARIDVASRTLVDFIPRAGACNSTMWVSPSGRWWHLLEGAAATGLQYITIDAVTKTVVSSEALAGNSIISVAFAANGRRYELRASTTTVSVHAWPDGPSTSPLWSVSFGIASADISTRMAVGLGGVYVVLEQNGTFDIRRFDLSDGAELARSQVIRGSNSVAHHLVAFSDRVYLSLSEFLGGALSNGVLMRFHALSLVTDRTVSAPITSPGGFGQLFFDDAAERGHLEIIRCSLR
jgi:hypothetical protein